jgi:hypothetical protein
MSNAERRVQNEEVGIRRTHEFPSMTYSLISCFLALASETT